MPQSPFKSGQKFRVVGSKLVYTLVKLEGFDMWTLVYDFTNEFGRHRGMWMSPYQAFTPEEAMDGAKWEPVEG